MNVHCMRWCKYAHVSTYMKSKSPVSVHMVTTGSVHTMKGYRGDQGPHTAVLPHTHTHTLSWNVTGYCNQKWAARGGLHSYGFKLHLYSITGRINKDTKSPHSHDPGHYI